VNELPMFCPGTQGFLRGRYDRLCRKEESLAFMLNYVELLTGSAAGCHCHYLLQLACGPMLRAAFDIGSGSLKVQVGRVSGGRIAEFIYSQETFV
jgi:hypothetical protein